MVIPTKPVFKIKKHAIHNIHRLAWAHMLVGPGQLPSVPMH